MSIIKIEDIAYVRFSAPDLDAMEVFLNEFGMHRAHRDGDTLYMRGTGPAPFVHVTHLGEAGFQGLGFRAESVADLEKLAKAEGVSVAASDAPGGGRIVTLADPDGFRIDVIAGDAAVAEMAVPSREAVNTGRETPRTNLVKRVKAGPAHVKRLGHGVLNVTDFRRSEAWYKERFGFITSDEIAIEGFPDSIGAFMRCDRGDQPTDHHTLFLMGLGTPKFNHAAFEVADLDDLMAGNQHLKDKGRSHEWGVGRHILGSQIFDYWRDPWGHAVEHWTDGDRMNAGFGSNKVGIEELLGTQWGPAAPPTMA
jgi:catechol 2,3-dioxygenase-like lactoylglutathione lyase family enzyme